MDALAVAEAEHFGNLCVYEPNLIHVFEFSSQVHLLPNSARKSKLPSLSTMPLTSEVTLQEHSQFSPGQAVLSLGHLLQS